MANVGVSGTGVTSPSVSDATTRRLSTPLCVSPVALRTGQPAFDAVRRDS
jgi:hypothetical protein